jgi:hypothetical protein
MRWRHLAVAFVASTALASDVDEEIIRHLEFFEKLPVVEDMEIVELADDTKVASTEAQEQEPDEERDHD